MKKIILTLLVFASCLQLNGQTFLKYYSAGLNERGIYFYSGNGYELFGYKYSGLQGKYQLLHVDSNGDSLSSIYTNYNYLYRLSDNSFLTTYSILDTGNLDTIVVSEVDTLGNENVLFKLPDTNNIIASKIILTSDSGYLIGGNSDQIISSNANIIKTNSSGNILWQNSFLQNLHCGQDIKELFETSDKHYMVHSYHSCCCMTYPGDIFVAKLDSAGNTDWIYNYRDDWVGFNGQLVEDNGNFILIGYDSLTKISSTGSVIWQKPNSAYSQVYASITPGITDGFYACGGIYYPTQKLIITKFDDNGDSLTSFIFSGQQNIYGEYMQQLPDGRLACIGGQSSDTSSNGYPKQTFFLICDSLGDVVSSTNTLIKSKNDFSIFPNPTTGSFTINFHDQSSNIDVIITNVFGEEVSRSKCQNKSRLDLEIKGESGLYFVKVTAGEKTGIYKIVKL